MSYQRAKYYFRAHMRGNFSRWLHIYGWELIFMILILLELGFMLYFHKNILPNTVNEVGFTGTSILIGFLLLARYYRRDKRYISSEGPRSRNKLTWISLLLLIAGMVAAAFSLSGIFRDIPIHPGTSDIIPLIQSGVRRFLHGETVYAPVAMPGYELPQTYLPLQWMPFTIAELLHVDYRWVAVGIFFLASLIIVLRCNRVSPLQGLLSVILILCFGWMLLVNDQGIPGMSVELMVAGYYMLLIVGLSNSNPWIRGGAIALCLLSRYSLVLWLPLWAFAEFSRGDKRDFFRSSLTVAVMVLGIYIIPFLSRDWNTFGQAYEYYTKAANGAWSNPGKSGVPFVLDLGLGLAREFYVHLPNLPVPERLHLLQKVHIIACLGSSVLLGAWYWINRNKIHLRIFLLASFKIYLALFLGLIQVPYPYLMITAAAVSIAIFAELPRYRILQNR